MPTQHSENPLLPSLRYKHYVIFAVASHMTQTLIYFHLRIPFYAERSTGQITVSPPAKPGAYLTELVRRRQSWRPGITRSHGAGGHENTTQTNYCCLNGSGHRSFLVGCRLRKPFHKDGRQDCRTRGYGKVRRGDPAEGMLPSPEKCAPTLALPEKDGLYKPRSPEDVAPSRARHPYHRRNRGPSPSRCRLAWRCVRAGLR